MTRPYSQLPKPGLDKTPAPRVRANGSAVDQAVIGHPQESGRGMRMQGWAFRLALLVVVIVLTGAGAGLLAATLLPVQYASRAELQYRVPQPDSGDLLREDRRLSTQLVLLRSRLVLGPIATKAGTTPEELAERVSAKVVDNSEIIEVEVRDSTPEEAHTTLDEILAGYQSHANADWENPVRAYLEAQLDEVKNRRTSAGLAPDEATALAQSEAIIRGLLDPAKLPRSVVPESPWGPPAQIVAAPYEVPGRVGPTPQLTTAAGALAGSVIAALVVLVVVRRRPAE